MINTSRAVRQSSVLAAEWGRNGRLLDNTEHTRTLQRETSGGFYGKAKSDETKAKEASERRYTGRKNICGKCHMAMAVGTDHECD